MTADESESAGIAVALRRRVGAELFLISALVLFLELACIRWFPAHVLFLTFFTNVVLLACFLGMSAGCLAADRRQNYLVWTPAMLLLAIVAAHAVGWNQSHASIRFDVGRQAAPQFVFFGAEYHAQDVSEFVVPIEFVCGFFFLSLALAFVGPGQELGRALNRIHQRLTAYTLNIVGSLAGIVLFGAFSYLQLPPIAWFLPAALMLAYFLFFRIPNVRGWAMYGQLATLLLVLCAVSSPVDWLLSPAGQRYWSPYYRIDYQPTSRTIDVNLIGHQQMVARHETFPAYALPHLLCRDAGRPPFQDVLIIGAGSGNDVSRAFQWGARHVDAVEIDPVIYALGKRDHPDLPYQDPRVTVHLDDGRNFLRSTERQYDLIVYALVDSLVLHSSYSNIRLESYLFTQQALADVQRRLKPGGMFVMYNYFRQGWIVARLDESLRQTFDAEPLVLTLPYLPRIESAESFDGFTIFLAGDEAALAPLRAAFRQQPHYWLQSSAESALAPAAPQNGFQAAAANEGEGSASERLAGGDWHRFGPAQIDAPAEPIELATDDWPFLYLRRPLIPLRPTLSGMAVMAVLSVLLLAAFGSGTAAGDTSLGALDGRMFFLGAGFMLIETKAVVQMALLFGSTWIVNSVVFGGILSMILLANLYVQVRRPQRVWPYYLGLAIALVANLIVPIDVFLGRGEALQWIGSCALVLSPIAFAGVIFAISFARAPAANRAFGANIAGAMLGGLAENASMLLGFHALLWVALLIYALSIWPSGVHSRPQIADQTP